MRDGKGTEQFLKSLGQKGFLDVPRCRQECKGKSGAWNDKRFQE